MAWLQFRTRRCLLTIIIFCLLMPLFSCGSSNVFDGLSDEESKEARTENALILLDTGEYQAAVYQLTALSNDYPDDSIFLQYLSNAYAGQAGLDTINMLEVIGDLEDNGESGSIDMVGLVIGNDNGQLTIAEVAAKLEYIEAAIDSLEAIGTLNSDQVIQAGLLGAVHLTLTLADIVMNDTGSDVITMTDGGLEALYSQPADFSEVSDATLQEISNDLQKVGNAVDELSDGGTQTNDLSQDLADFESSIDQDGNGFIGREELENFIDNL